jgi:Protein of unknown function (DUF4012)
VDFHQEEEIWGVEDVERVDKLRMRPPFEQRFGQRLQLTCCGIVLALFLCSSFTAIFSSLLYSPLYFRDMNLAHNGVQDLHRAQSLLLSLQHQPFNQENIRQAQQEFASAAQVFEQLNRSIQSLPALAFYLPFVGGRLQAAQHLVPLADNFSRAGELSCQLLQLLLKSLHDPLNPNTVTLTVRDMNILSTNLHAVHQLVRRGFHELDQIQPDDVQFGDQFDSQIALLRQYEPGILHWLTLLEAALPALPQLLGIQQPAHYLLEMLDSSEIRPGGGFIGNYGLITFQDARLQQMHITDVDLLDLPFAQAGGFIPFPPEYRWFPLSHNQWSFRDSNLDADFPTSAQFGLHNFQLEGGPAPLEGLIAITPALIQQSLAITGPILIPDYHETVTSQNLIERIHYYQLGAGHGSSKILSSDGLSSQRKHFTALLASYLFARLRHLSNREQGQLVHLLLNSLQTKDLQLYFPRQEIEALLSQAQIDGRVRQASDDLFVVDANINGNKANIFIHSTVTDVVNIDNDGNAIHSLTLRYAWTTPGEVFGNALYRDYVQIYVPTTSQLQAQFGWDQSSTTNRSGHLIWSGMISMFYGDVRMIQLSWIVPHAVQIDAQGKRHFFYDVQHQAGTDRLLHIQVNLPGCALISGTSGASLEHDEQSAWLDQMVSHDLPMSIDYTCS